MLYAVVILLMALIFSNAVTTIIEHDFDSAANCLVCIQNAGLVDKNCQMVTMEQEIFTNHLIQSISVSCKHLDESTGHQILYTGVYEAPSTIEEDECEETCSIQKHRSSPFPADPLKTDKASQRTAPESQTLSISSIITERVILTKESLQGHEKEVLDIVHPKVT